MASDESMSFLHSFSQDEDLEDDMDDGHPHNLSRLSVCTSSSLCGIDDDDDDDAALSMYVSHLSIESFEDEEFPQRKEVSSDSESESGRVKYSDSDGRKRNNGKKEKNSDNDDDDDVFEELNGGRGLMVITRPKGGRRSLCMDMEEVKACKELGFELEHERMLELPSPRNNNTSSGANSPISNWRISSPGDNPRDVKARLKVWAQAVAMASTSKYAN